MAISWNNAGSLKGPKGDAGTSTRVSSVDVQSNSDVAIDSLSPATGVQVGDTIIDTKGDTYTITSIVNDTTVHVSNALAANLMGPQGPKGADGRDGTGVSVKGSVENADALPTEGVEVGDAYITADDGHMHVWSGTEWVDSGEVKGPKGDKGEPGAAGKDGAAGQRGSVWTLGTGAPTSTEGVLAGDVYLDTATGTYYQAQNATA